MGSHSDPGLPIGVFDSGVGGLTVLSALQRALPKEDFLYFGDTARVPYGSKPLEMVRRFAWEISGYLIHQGVKAIVVACNTASSAALPELSGSLSVPVFNVLEPAVAEAKAIGGQVGLIGTEGTIKSGSYQKQFDEEIWSKACALFVPIVEEGLWADAVAKRVADYYLHDAPKDLGTLILGCTHYPFLKPVIDEVLPGVRLIDSAEATAKVVKAGIKKNPAGAGSVKHFVTGDLEAYTVLARRLGVEVHQAERVPLDEL